MKQFFHRDVQNSGAAIFLWKHIPKSWYLPKMILN